MPVYIYIDVLAKSTISNWWGVPLIERGGTANRKGDIACKKGGTNNSSRYLLSIPNSIKALKYIICIFCLIFWVKN